MRTVVLRLTISALLLFGASFAATAGQQSGYVTIEHLPFGGSSTTAGYTFFYVTGTKTGNPACSIHNRWVINNDWPAAKIQIATLMAAVLSGRPVSVGGAGNCQVWSTDETALNIVLQ